MSPAKSGAISVSTSASARGSAGAVQLGAADDERIVPIADEGERGVQRRRHGLGAVGPPLGLARDDDVAPSRQRAKPQRQRFPRSPAHDDRVWPIVTRRQVLQILGQPPGRLPLSLPMQPLRATAAIRLSFTGSHRRPGDAASTRGIVRSAAGGIRFRSIPTAGALSAAHTAASATPELAQWGAVGGRRRAFSIPAARAL